MRPLIATLVLLTILVAALLAQKAMAEPRVPVTPTVTAARTRPPTARERRILRCIRAIESRGRYHAVSRSGRYRGAYQADASFFRSYSRGAERHWTGRHELAPPVVQDRVALRGLRARGLSPWPPARGRCR